MECLKKTIPDLNIYTSKEAGQNYQLLLPLLYSYECMTIPEYLYIVVERNQSHSRKFTEDNDIFKQQSVYERTILCTLENIQCDANDKNILAREVSEHYKFIKEFKVIHSCDKSLNYLNFLKRYYSRLTWRQWLSLFKSYIIKSVKW